MKEKFNGFLENARFLAERFGVVPLLYGSLGLAYLTGRDFGIDDIDVLIPRVLLTERWAEFRSILTAAGYTLVDEHEHAFERGGMAYAYADIEDLESFARISVKELRPYESEGVRFLLLSEEQYLTVYRRSFQDGYRINVRKKRDAEKIEFLEHTLREKEAMRQHFGAEA